ncbi:DUF599 domain-containing protein [Geminicoccus harenae]|uniref:DUF599 domain-containing protein n=1 Tax=Geminicoccus harenae TaxID=2498453 RepID=UPI00168B409E|nr:DUF599 domain-containing protein [Geminicoccus harenae]
MTADVIQFTGRWADLVACVALIGCWLLYPHVLALVARRRITLNEAMVEIRQDWMVSMLQRENRITDAALVGHVLSSASFFASTTVLVIGALIGALANAQTIVATLGQFLLDHPPTVWLTQLKIVVILTIFIYGFFKFTWAIRQYNYMIALIGAAPPAPMPDATIAPLARIYAAHFSRAATDFNHGLRAYYFSLAGFAWLIDPLIVPPTLLMIVAILARRQTRSGVRDDVQAARVALR